MNTNWTSNQPEQDLRSLEERQELLWEMEQEHKRQELLRQMKRTNLPEGYVVQVSQFEAHPIATIVGVVVGVGSLAIGFSIISWIWSALGL